MEDLTPEAIVSYRFKQALRGYAIDEVDALLDRLADQVEGHLAELEQLRERVRVAEAAAQTTKETEATLQRTLVVAQQAAERNLADAAAQADATVASATADAERLRRDAEEAADQLRGEAYEEATRVRTEADAEATRVRTEADAEATQLRSEARSEATRVVEDAQQLARHEVESARARIEEAARRHAELVQDINEHRDALRANLASLDELTLRTPPAPSEDLVVGELPDRWIVDADDEDTPHVWHGPVGSTEDAEREDAEQDGWHSDDGPHLTVRVHEEHTGAEPHHAPLGSDARDGG